MATVQPNGLILVTGANGYIGSVTVKTLLDRGYRVRGTVRSAKENAWMNEYFGSSFSLAEIPDLSKPAAFDEAVRGVDGIMHIAANVSYNPTDEAIVEEMKLSNINMLTAAAKEPSVKRAVIVSSIGACVSNTPGVPYEITTETWNDDALAAAKQPWDGENPAIRAAILYNAAKTVSEKAAWEWMDTNKPHFVLNTVVPNVNLGTLVAPQHLGYRTTCAVLEAFVNGVSIASIFVPPQNFVNVTDTALLCLAGLTLEQVKGERMLAFAGQYGWKAILEIINRRFPELKKIDHVDEPAVDCGKVHNERSVEILKLMGRQGFTNLEDTIVEAVEAIVAAHKLEGVPENKVTKMAAQFTA